MRSPIRVWPVGNKNNSEIVLYQILTTGFVGQIVTLNSLMFHLAYSNPHLWNIISQAALVLPDSWGICWAVKKLTGKKIQRYPGIDFIDFLCRLAAEKKWRIFLLGGEKTVVTKAAENLKEKYPGLTIAGVQHGYFLPAEIPDIIIRIKNSKSHLLLVGLDIPRQEIFIGENLQRLGVNIAIGVGGSFDIISGKIARAPFFMRKLGLEWLFRFYLQPWRICRIWKLPLFGQLIWRLKINREKILTLTETNNIQ